MVQLFLNTTNAVEITSKNYKDLIEYVTKTINLPPQSFYLEQNGKPISTQMVGEDSPLHVRLRILGGKGGFGSMLRAIGAQIEKTTNREACRDLSGRRLRDINEEKRLKAWLDKQGEREREAEERKKRKIEKLLAVPKHEFKDEEYEEARSKLTEKVHDAVEEGFRKANGRPSDLKRRHEPSTSKQATTNTKTKKAALWIDDDLSDSGESDDSDDEHDAKTKKLTLETKDSEASNSSEQQTTGSDKKSLSNDETNSSDSEPVSVVSN